MDNSSIIFRVHSLKFTMTDLSVVTTMYKSAASLEEFYSRVAATAQKITNNFEIIFVNDGSPDNSLDIVINLSKKDPRVKVIDFSRNFGHHKAIMTGLAHTSGEKVFLIDCDLEEAPELLQQFWDELNTNPELDHVYGVQGKTRKGGLFERFSGALWYKLINSISDIKVPKNHLTVKLASKRFIDSLMEFKEQELNFATLVTLNGYESKALVVQKGHKETSTYNILKKFNIIVNTITSSSSFPLWLIFYFGLTVNLLASIFILYLVYQRIVMGVTIIGWTSLMVMTTFFGGAMILSLGIIGLYISKILGEVKDRPYTIIRAKYNF